jgi:hypothetical protein
MANTSSLRSLSLDDALVAPALMLRLSGSPTSLLDLAPDQVRLAGKLHALGWVVLTGPRRASVVLTGLGLEARSDMLCAAAEALSDYARRVPVA